MLPTVAGDRLACHAAAVAGVAPVVVHRVGVQLFTPAPRLVNPEAIAVTRYWREVARHDYLVPGFIATDKDKHRPFVVIHNKPFKAVGVKIQFVQCLMVAIGMVQIAHQTLHPVMPVVAPFQQMPVEAGVVVPLPPLGKLVAHKQQLFTGKANSQP